MTPAKPQLLDRMGSIMRTAFYSRRTEEVYGGWVRQFIFFHGKRHPREVGEAEVAASAQEQALARNLHEKVPGKPPGLLLCGWNGGKGGRCSRKVSDVCGSMLLCDGWISARAGLGRARLCAASGVVRRWRASASSPRMRVSNPVCARTLSAASSASRRHFSPTPMVTASIRVNKASRVWGCAPVPPRCAVRGWSYVSEGDS